MPHSSPRPDSPAAPFWRRRSTVVLLMLLVIGLFYLAREHYAHAAQLLPYLILLLCPLLHLFGHRHGPDASQHRAAESAKNTPRE